jgi:hypothetical protein
MTDPEAYSENWTYRLERGGGLNGKTDAYVVLSGDYIVAELDLHFYGQDEGEVANERTTALAETHARKICATPDMIAALTRLLKAADNSNLDKPTLENARAALLKAGA